MYARNMRALGEVIQHRLCLISENQIRGAESTFDLEGTPMTVRQFDDRIDFVAPPVPVVTNPSVYALRIDSEVAFAHAFEHEGQTYRGARAAV